MQTIRSPSRCRVCYWRIERANCSQKRKEGTWTLWSPKRTSFHLKFFRADTRIEATWKAFCAFFRDSSRNATFPLVLLVYLYIYHVIQVLTFTWLQWPSAPCLNVYWPLTVLLSLMKSVNSHCNLKSCSATTFSYVAVCSRGIKHRDNSSLRAFPQMKT